MDIRSSYTDNFKQQSNEDSPDLFRILTTRMCSAPCSPSAVHSQAWELLGCLPGGKQLIGLKTNYHPNPPWKLVRFLHVQRTIKQGQNKLGLTRKI
jgi:hypothetical protein